jgi:hypothetical protein
MHIHTKDFFKVKIAEMLHDKVFILDRRELNEKYRDEQCTYKEILLKLEDMANILPMLPPFNI